MNVLITGGNRGLGFALIDVFSTNGHNVMSIVRSLEAKQVIEKHFPQCEAFVADITDYSDLKNSVCLGNKKIDILINNAGEGGLGTSVTNTDPDEVERHFMVHCLGAFNVVKAFYPAIVMATEPMIINVSSRLGSMFNNASGTYTGKGFTYAYRIAKCAQNMLTQCLSQELGALGVKVCALHPGRLLTSSGSFDAHMEPHESARRIYSLIVENKIENGGYYCVEEGDLPW